VVIGAATSWCTLDRLGPNHLFGLVDDRSDDCAIADAELLEQHQRDLLGGRTEAAAVLMAHLRLADQRDKRHHGSGEIGRHLNLAPAALCGERHGA